MLNHSSTENTGVKREEHNKHGKYGPITHAVGYNGGRIK
jgi:hypothetical protein